MAGVSAVVGVRFGGDDNTAGGGGVNGAVADLEDAVGKKTGAGNNRGEQTADDKSFDGAAFLAGDGRGGETQAIVETHYVM